MAHEQPAVEFIDTSDYERTSARALPHISPARLLAIGGFTAAAMAAASYAGASVEATANQGANLIQPDTTVFLDQGDASLHTHELVELFCSFNITPNGLRPARTVSVFGHRISGYTPVSQPFAVQLKRPSAQNVAIVYTGLGANVDRIQHFDVQARGDYVAVQVDEPQFAGVGSKDAVDEKVQLREGYELSGKSGMIRYEVGRWGGKYVVALACDRHGAQKVEQGVVDAQPELSPKTPWDMVFAKPPGS